MAKLTRNSKILLYGFLAAGLIGVGILGYAIWSITSFVDRVGSLSEEIPDELKEPRVVQANQKVVRTEVFKKNAPTFMDTVRRGTEARDEKEKQKIISNETSKKIFGYSDLGVCGNEIFASGEFGAFVFDRELKPNREILLEPIAEKISFLGFEQMHYRNVTADLSLVKLSADRCGFMSLSSVDGLTVFDVKGSIVWRHGDRSSKIKASDIWKRPSQEEIDKESWITEVTIDDINGDGVSEYLISKKKDGIRALDTNGNTIWFQPDDFPTSEIRVIDVDGDGSKELFELKGRATSVRDLKTGSLVRRIDIDGWSKTVLFPAENDKNKAINLIDLDGNKMQISDLENRVLVEAKAPLSEIELNRPKTPLPTPIYSGNQIALPVDLDARDKVNAWEPSATWFLAGKEKKKHLAVVADFTGISRATFYIYDEKGNLLYHEILPESAEKILKLANEDGIESVLVAGHDTIWKFEME
jgi:hypothetical protein